MLSNNKFEVEQASAVDALPAQNERAVVELRKFVAELIANADHGGGVV